MVQSPRKRFEYERVRFLRTKGKSYNDIKKELGLSKSTISLWCRDISLSDQQRYALLHSSKRRAAQRLGADANREKREREVLAIKNLAREEIKEVSKEIFKVAGAVLYWAEGTKTKNTSISNSDPRVIKFMVNWWEQVFGICPANLKAHVHIHYGNDEKKIKKFWSSLTRIPLENFGKSFLKPKGTGHRTHILPNGIIQIRVKGKGTVNVRHRIMAWVEKIYELSIN